MAVVDQFVSLSSNDTRIGSAQEGDVGCGSNGEVTVTVGSCGKGQVCQREEDTTLHTAASIQMTGFNLDLRPGIAFCYIYYLYSILACELVMQKEIFQCLCIFIIHAAKI